MELISSICFSTAVGTGKEVSLVFGAPLLGTGNRMIQNLSRGDKAVTEFSHCKTTMASRARSREEALEKDEAMNPIFIT
jgi:hypothetical protein